MMGRIYDRSSGLIMEDDSGETNMRRAAVMQAIQERGYSQKMNPDDLRVDDLSVKELGEMYGLPKKFDIHKRPATDRDPIRNAKAYAVGKWLAQRKIKAAKKKKTTSKKTKATKPKSKSKRKKR